MTLADLDTIKRRIGRAFGAVRNASGAEYEISYQAWETDFTTDFRAIGLKSPEQLEDEFLNLFIWMWSLKDHLKTCLATRGLHGKIVEEEVNRCHELGYAADIANRAKHGVLRQSRSGEFAKLGDVGFTAPQESIERIIVAGSEVTVHFRDLNLVQIRATVTTNSGARLDAITVLDEAMKRWEASIISKIMP